MWIQLSLAQQAVLCHLAIVQGNWKFSRSQTDCAVGEEGFCISRGFLSRIKGVFKK